MSNEILFACDLDNTLIHSVKHKRPDDVCVEWIHDKEQGFMTPEAIRLLRQLPETVRLVPVTTRSIAQYSRIQWPEGCRPRHAVTTNGAILLEDGQPEAAWQAALAPFTAPLREDMQRLAEELYATGRFLRCRVVDDSYVFAYCGADLKPWEVAAQYRDDPRFRVTSSGKKVYFFPENVNKGAAVLRLREMLGGAKLICAGDSSIDIPMLNRADLAIVPEKNHLQVEGCAENRACTGEDFSCDVLRLVLAQAE